MSWRHTTPILPALHSNAGQLVKDGEYVMWGIKGREMAKKANLIFTHGSKSNLLGEVESWFI